MLEDTKEVFRSRSLRELSKGLNIFLRQTSMDIHVHQLSYSNETVLGQNQIFFFLKLRNLSDSNFR